MQTQNDFQTENKTQVAIGGHSLSAKNESWTRRAHNKSETAV